MPLTAVPDSVWRFLATAVVMTTMAACAESDLGTEYAEISESESGFIFDEPSLRNGYRRFISGQNASFDVTTIGVYGPRTGDLPQAQIVLVETPPGRHFGRILTPKDSLKRWKLFEEQTPIFGASGSTTNGVGSVRYTAFTANRMSCVAWTQGFDPRYDQSAGSHMLAGYYCRAGSAPLPDRESEEIVKLVGHREYGPP